MRVEAARLPFLVFHRVAGDDALARADRADPSDPALAVANRVLLDDQTLLAVLHLLDTRRPIAKLRVDVIVPKVERLEDMTVGIDDVIGAAHQRVLRGELYDAASYRSRERSASLNVVQNVERRHANYAPHPVPPR